VAQRQVTAMYSAASGLPHLLAPPGFIPAPSGGATKLFGWVATGLVEEAQALAGRQKPETAVAGQAAGLVVVLRRLLPRSKQLNITRQ
jgi:hypothetical protein